MHSRTFQDAQQNPGWTAKPRMHSKTQRTQQNLGGQITPGQCTQQKPSGSNRFNQAQCHSLSLGLGTALGLGGPVLAHSVFSPLSPLNPLGSVLLHLQPLKSEIRNQKSKIHSLAPSPFQNLSWGFPVGGVVWWWWWLWGFWSDFRFLISDF